MTFRPMAAALLLGLALPATATPEEDADVRRFEWVVMVRTHSDFPDAVARAEIAAGKAGGAVLAEMRMDALDQHEDHRMLVRTIDRESIGPVLESVRKTRGVIGVSVAALPETPTWPGSPGFMESYKADSDLSRVGNAGRVLMRHDVPPIADARELLEVADVVAGPGLPALESMGGFTLNISELFKRMKESSWRKREEKLRTTPLAILPDDGSTTASPESPAP